MSLIRMLQCLVASWLVLVPLLADEIVRKDSDPAKETHQDAAPAGEVDAVDLIDGADSAEGALKAFVAASKAADNEAALLMVDPPIRKLLIPEIAIERFAIDSLMTEYSLFGQDKDAMQFMLLYFARRDLINLQSLEILETRIVDEDRIVFTVYTTEGSYHHEGNTHTVNEVMAVRREGKWYLFKLIGLLTNYFRESGLPQSTEPPMLRIKKAEPDSPDRRDADFVLEFLVPIESMHSELVRCSESREIAECMVLSSRIDRFLKSVENRAIRGEFKTREEIKRAFDQGEPWLEELGGKIPLAIQPGVNRLQQQLIPLTESELK